MANKKLFASAAVVAPTLVQNNAGGVAYKFSAKAALAQYASTGCLNGTYYASATDQLDTVLALAAKVEPEFVAKTAVYAREQGHMRDLPALLVATLASSKQGAPYFAKVFPRVIDGGKMLCNFAQIIRSGKCGRKSFGTMPKRLMRTWFDSRSDDAVFRNSVGTANPSLADVIRMVRPHPATDSRRALYGYLSGRNAPEHAFNASHLSRTIQEYEAFKANPEGSEVPDVPHLMLTSLPLTDAHWTSIARNMGWQATRMNLNTMLRHGVFKDRGMVRLIADRLREESEIRHARVFPYQLLAAYLNADPELPREVIDGLHDAMEIAVQNVPAIDGKVYVFPDVSGSMQSAVTGERKGSTSKVRCVDVAALIAASIVRRNPSAEVIPFETRIVKLGLEPRDTIMTNAQKLASVGGGGTCCSAPLAELNRRGAQADLVIYASDNESWVDSGSVYSRGTATMAEWKKFTARKGNEKAKMVCIDLTPNGTTQAKESSNILNVGGFSDAVFDVIAKFVQSGSDAKHWTSVIEGVTI